MTIYEADGFWVDARADDDGEVRVAVNGPYGAVWRRSLWPRWSFNWIFAPTCWFSTLESLRQRAIKVANRHGRRTHHIQSAREKLVRWNEEHQARQQIEDELTS